MARKKTVKSETTDLAQPQNRTEEFLAKIAGLVDTLPQGEFSRLERYLKYIAENGGGGGGGGVTSFNSRTGAVTPESGDYSEFYAPSGYGLGTISDRLPSDTDLNNITANGFYTWGGYPLTNEPTLLQSGYCSMLVCNGWQFVFSGNSRGEAQRLLTSTWQPWEYVNPRLTIASGQTTSDEYRTTEKFGGKPVYVKAIELGALPNNSSITVNHGIANCVPLRVYGVTSTGVTLPYHIGAVSGNITATSTAIVVVTNNDSSSATGTAIFYYTKSA